MQHQILRTNIQRNVWSRSGEFNLLLLGFTVTAEQLGCVDVCTFTGFLRLDFLVLLLVNFQTQ